MSCILENNSFNQCKNNEKYIRHITLPYTHKLRDQECTECSYFSECLQIAPSALRFNGLSCKRTLALP